jgi:predicted dehydrogenase
MTNAASPLPRRKFLRHLAAGAAIVTLPRGAGAETPAVAPKPPAVPGKIRVACIGVGNRGYSALIHCLRSAEVVALCDVDDLMMRDSLVRVMEEGHRDILNVKRFKDYREMFANFADEFDAVTICTPDHHHYLPAMLALRHGKHVFLEKPLTHTVGEARALKAAARQAGVVTQMGNQGHTTEGIRLVREWFEHGLLGEVREIVSWGPAMGGQYFYRPDKIPPSPGGGKGRLDWDLWLGPADAREFAPVYEPLLWRGWWDFGNGTLGDWAAHTLDSAFWSLQLGAPERVEVEVSETNAHVVPRWAVVRYHFPARGHLPPVKLTWYEGREVQPPRPAFWGDGDYPDRGMLMLGERQALFHAGRPDSPRLVSRPAMEELRRHPPARRYPRVRGGPLEEWLQAIRGHGTQPGSSFDYAADLTQMILLGTVAMRAGQGFTWDDQAGRITSDPDLNRFIDIRAREGWRI